MCIRRASHYVARVHLRQLIVVACSQVPAARIRTRGVHGNGEDWNPMGPMGFPWVPWDSHGNGSKISHGMGMGWEWELSAWEWELRRGSCHQQL